MLRHGPPEPLASRSIPPEDPASSNPPRNECVYALISFRISGIVGFGRRLPSIPGFWPLKHQFRPLSLPDLTIE